MQSAGKSNRVDVCSLASIVTLCPNVSDEVANQHMVPPVLDGARLEGLGPTRDVTQEEIDTFHRDGVVKLEGILPKAAVDFLEDCFTDIFGANAEEYPKDPKRGGGARSAASHDDIADKVVKNGQAGQLLLEGNKDWSQRTGRMVTEANCSRWHTDVQRFCYSRPIAQAIGQLLQTKRLKFHHDHLFFKQADSLIRTGFHQDSAFFNLAGEQVAIAWVPCDVVTRDSGAMGYVRGSHKGKTYARFNLISNEQSLKEEMQEMGAELQPDMENGGIEANEDKYDIIYHECKPGDVVVHHLNTIHGSAGNTSTSRHRRAASIRYIGDDAVFKAAATDPKFQASYNPTFKDGKVLKTKKNWSRIPDGTKLEGGLYPVLWEEPAASTAKL